MIFISKITRFCLTSILIVLIITILLWPQNLYNGISKGLVLCANVIIPSVFPFCVLSLMLFNLIRLNGSRLPIFNIDSNIFLIIIMSMIGGYPAGAKLISTSYNKGGIDKLTANILLLFCVNAGPSFVISAIGYSAFSSTKIGILLYLSHIVSTIEIFLFFRKRLTNVKVKPMIPTRFSDTFVISVSEASKTMIIICAYVIFFSGILSVIKGFNIPLVFEQALTFSLEISSGIFECKNLYLIAFLLGFGGFSIILQIFSISSSILNKPLKFIFFRIIHGGFSVVNLFILLKIFPTKLGTISTPGDYIYQVNSTGVVFSILLIGFALLLVSSVLYRQYCGKLSNDML